MNVKFSLMTGAAIACAVLAGCKAPKAQSVTPVPAPRPVKPAAVESAPAEKPASVKPVEVNRCKCAPGTVHDTACLCGASDCKCKVRPPEPEFTVYRVKSGDTLSGICVRYKLRQSKVLELNPGMSANKLYAGIKIKLPGVIELKEEDSRNAKASTVKLAAKPAAGSSVKAASYTGATKLYTVKSGDSLGKIAYSNGITVKCLKEMNGLKKNTIRIGQKLKVPAEKVVAKSAKAAPAKPAKPVASATPAAPAAAPEAAPVPAAAPEAAPAPAVEQPVVEAPAAPEPVSALTHTVQDGEDTVSIAIHYNVSPSAIMDLNDLKNTDTLKPGQVLKLPANAKVQ
jgi:LysM repeat protein